MSKLAEPQPNGSRKYHPNSSDKNETPKLAVGAQYQGNFCRGTGNFNPERAALESERAECARSCLEQRPDSGRDGEGLGVFIDETGDLQPKRQTVILQHGQRDRGDAE